MTVPALLERYLDVYSRRDVAAPVTCLSDDIVFEDVSNAGGGMRIKGPAAFAELAEQAAAMFMSRQQTFRNAMIEGKRAVMRGSPFKTIADGKLTRIVDLS